MNDALERVKRALMKGQRVVTYYCSQEHPTHVAGDYQEDDVAPLYCFCGSLIVDAVEQGDEDEDDEE